LLDTFGAQVSSDHERYPADVKCLGFLYLYVGRYPRNNASRNTWPSTILIFSCSVILMSTPLSWRNSEFDNHKGNPFARMIRSIPCILQHSEPSRVNPSARVNRLISAPDRPGKGFPFLYSPFRIDSCQGKTFPPGRATSASPLFPVPPTGRGASGAP
ncbi:MAG: hypothetical protein BECKG1743E_GA0114224_101741, partial [Candidatus Kentron sp. G]